MHPTNNRIVFGALLFLLIANIQRFASLRPETRNRFHLDRITCSILKPTVVKSARCVLKYISLHNMKVDFQIHATRPVRNIWIHGIFYYKFNGIVYNKFPMEHWENICEFFAGKKENNFILDWFLSRLQPFSNLNHSCPYSSFIAKSDNVSSDEIFGFDKAILPSGQFRIDLSITEEDRIPALDIKLFTTNAEHHYEKI